ncbi:hypothetical protein Tco_0919552, partial [Tanacetum coccineum]
LTKERRAQLELAEIIDGMRKGQGPKEKELILLMVKSADIGDKYAWRLLWDAGN